MNPLTKNITEFLSKNKVATVCFNDKQNKPYCINCFYCFIEKEAILIFKSSYGTTHDEYIKQNNPLAGTIIADQLDVTQLKGIQFTGILLDQHQINDKKLSLSYLKTFPLSIAMPGYLWAVQLEYIKYTDNTLGFGNKTIWQK